VHIRSYQPLDDLFELQVGDQIIPVGSEGLTGLRGEAVERK
jgi:DtxR family Mn-dependent transcriptional regulator